MTDKEENLTEKEQIKLLKHYISELSKYIEETAAILDINTSATILGKNCIEYWAVLSSVSNDTIKKLQQENKELKQSQEQIIIDGVEVLKEKINMCFILLLNKLETPETIEQTIYEHLNAFVKEWSTQLARKTQECEELKEEISKLQLNEYHYKNELKKYKKGIHKYRNLLKYEINNLRLSRREFLKMVGRYPKFEKDNIKLALDTFNRKLELIDNPSRYHKALGALEDIGKIIKINCEEICGRKFEDCNDTSCFSVELLDITHTLKELEDDE